MRQNKILLLFFTTLFDILEGLKLVQIVQIINDVQIVKYLIPKKYNSDNFEYIWSILIAGCGADTLAPRMIHLMCQSWRRGEFVSSQEQLGI